MLEPLDKILNRVTMYRLTLYYLIVLVVAAICLSLFTLVPYKTFDIGISAGVVLLSCFVANILFAKFFKAVTNVESVFITALILLFIFPIKVPVNIPIVILASFAAMGSKYLLTIDKRHIFNPAAWAAFSVPLIIGQGATWWIGTSWMAPFVLIGGLILIRKIQRETLVLNFLIPYLILVIGASLLHNGSLTGVLTTLQTGFLHSALLFFAFVMLTEPFTSPPTKRLQSYYAWTLSLLYTTPQLRLFSISLTPETALVVTNIFSYIVSPKYRFVLKLKEKIKATADTYIFNFGRVEKFSFVPGQYMEWTLPHKNIDSRGNRRYFSISSSPHEDLMITVKFYKASSSYKKALFSLDSHKEIIAGSLAGDFVLPRNMQTPLVCIAGGVGITPFRSMIQYIIENKLLCNIILIFANKTKEDIMFADVFEKAQEYGVKTIYTLTEKESLPSNWQGKVGYISEDLVKEEVPDYKTRIFYVSGPQLMVQSVEKTLLNMHIKRKNIKTDFFPGYSS